MAYRGQLGPIDGKGHGCWTKKIKTTLIRDTLALVAPMQFHRGALVEVLRRRVKEMEDAAKRPYHTVAAYNDRVSAGGHQQGP